MTRHSPWPTRRARMTLGGVLLLGLLSQAGHPTAAAHALAQTAGSCVPTASLPAGLTSVTQALFLHTTAPAVTWSQQAQITATDGASGGNFGVSVAISGTTAVVGAKHEIGTGVNTGAAYVFVRGTGGWTQQAVLTASDGAPNDQFGFSLALSGSTAVVGAWNTTSSAGVAYVFVRSNGAWSQQAELTASAPDSQFGFSVALSGATAVVGAPNDNDVIGAAYVYGRSGTSAPAGRG